MHIESCPRCNSAMEPNGVCWACSLLPVALGSGAAGGLAPGLLSEGEQRESVSPLLAAPKVLFNFNTPIKCTRCGRQDTDTYYLKRCRGRYDLLCFREGSGCWERSSRTPCQQYDESGWECQSLADREVVYGPGFNQSVYVCDEHLHKALKDSANIQVFPLDD